MDLNNLIYKHVQEYGIASITDMFSFLLKEIGYIRLKVILFFIINLLMLGILILYIISDFSKENSGSLLLLCLLFITLYTLYRVTVVLHISSLLYMVHKFEHDVNVTLNSSMSIEEKAVKVAYISSVMIKNVALKTNIYKMTLLNIIYKHDSQGLRTMIL